MPKIKYFAIDPNGVTHTRTSDRIYSHAVVAKHSYDRALAMANDKGWARTDRSNFDYYCQIAAGNHPYAKKHWDEVAYAAHKKTVEWIADYNARMDAANAEDLANAIERTQGHTAESYCEAKRLERVASVEAKKADGYYDRFFCEGWCGRADLAHKLAAKCKNAVDVTILPAQTA